MLKDLSIRVFLASLLPFILHSIVMHFKMSSTLSIRFFQPLTALAVVQNPFSLNHYLDLLCSREHVRPPHQEYRVCYRPMRL